MQSSTHAYFAIKLGWIHDFPVPNPNFGGNPNNGAFLLNSAQDKTLIKIRAITMTLVLKRHQVR